MFKSAKDKSMLFCVDEGKSEKDKSMLFCVTDEGDTVSLPKSEFLAFVDTGREQQKEIEMLKSECKVKDAKIEELERECELKDLMDPQTVWPDGMPKHQYIWYLGNRIRCEMTHAEATKEYDRLTHEFTFREC